MRRLRLIADDLTGALDAAAQFTGGGREIAVFIGGRVPAKLPGEFALDIASREASADEAAALSASFAPLLRSGPGGVAFWKIDSLLRGSAAASIAAAFPATGASRCVIAPAFPFHGRVVRKGRLHVRGAAGWRQTGPDLAAELAGLGVRTRSARPGDPVPAGVSLWDAETDDDLRRIASAGAEHGDVLWCGSGGLACALAGSEPAVIRAADLGRPILGVLGSDHAATLVQLEACGADVLSVPTDTHGIPGRLASRGHCHVRFAVPGGAGRAAAREFIESHIGRLCESLSEPSTVLVSGGETLRSLCQCLGAEHLLVSGQVIAGVPVSRMVGGRWRRARVVSKSGAFGEAGLLSEITHAQGAK